MEIEFLIKKAAKIRINLLKSIHCAGSGHPGGSLSCVEILTYLYFHEMDVISEFCPTRDRFVLSKGHGCPAHYATLVERGFFSENELWNLRHTGAMLQGHPDVEIPGVEVPSGSLGQGFSMALGMALGGKRLKKKFHTYAVLGDGECNEGQVWEGAMFGAFHKLDNITVFVDYNNLQSDASCDKVTALSPLADKWKSFGWDVYDIDGHNFNSIQTAVTISKEVKGKPSVIIARTIKGKGVSFMENVPRWHGSLAPTDEELEQAIREIEASLGDLL